MTPIVPRYESAALLDGAPTDGPGSVHLEDPQAEAGEAIVQSGEFRERRERAVCWRFSALAAANATGAIGVVSG